MAINSPRAVRSNDPVLFAQQLQRYIAARQPKPDNSRQRTKRSGLPYCGYLRWKLNRLPAMQLLLNIAANVSRVKPKHPSVRVAWRLYFERYDAYGNPLIPPPDSGDDEVGKTAALPHGVLAAFVMNQEPTGSQYVASQHLTENLHLFYVHTLNWLTRVAQGFKRENFDDLIVTHARLYVFVLGPKPKKKRKQKPKKKTKKKHASKKRKTSKKPAGKRRLGHRGNGLVRRQASVRSSRNGRAGKRKDAKRVRKKA